jgi:putative transposase
MGISQATFYIWKKKYGELGAIEVRRLRQLEEENFRLKRLVADLTLDKSIVQEVIKKRSKAFAPMHVSGLQKILQGLATLGFMSCCGAVSRNV